MRRDIPPARPCTDTRKNARPRIISLVDRASLALHELSLSLSLSPQRVDSLARTRSLVQLPVYINVYVCVCSWMRIRRAFEMYDSRARTCRAFCRVCGDRARRSRCRCCFRLFWFLIYTHRKISAVCFPIVLE